MGEIDFSPLQSTFNGMAGKLVVVLLIVAAAVLVPLIILTLLRVPRRIREPLATLIAIGFFLWGFQTGVLHF
jgi:xanthine/uracil permease